jgi:phosphate starvation-inducible PhoH-like protein
MSSKKATTRPADTRRAAAARPVRRNIDFTPRTANQSHFVSSIKCHTVTFGIGPAGTGKTFVSVAVAIGMLISKEIESIVITRPIVEAAEDNLGFLPGDLKEKTDPYMVPLLDSLAKLFGAEMIEALFNSGQITVVPLAYMRGRSLEDAVIICDESQNATFEGLHMLLTRIGKNSRVIINGDPSQVDLRPRHRSGLTKVVDALQGLEDIDFVYFDTEDIQRHPVVGTIVKALEHHLHGATPTKETDGIGVLPLKRPENSTNALAGWTFPEA